MQKLVQSGSLSARNYQSRQFQTFSKFLDQIWMIFEICGPILVNLGHFWTESFRALAQYARQELFEGLVGVVV